jgi:hypothetical protein
MTGSPCGEKKGNNMKKVMLTGMVGLFTWITASSIGVACLFTLVTAGSASANPNPTNVVETVCSLKDFLAVGDGVTDDTVAISDAIAWAHRNNINTNYRPQIFVPAGVYAHKKLTINSLRGVRFIGENTLDPEKQKSQFKYIGTSGTAAIEIKSCGYLEFENIFFDLNSVSGVGSLILFSANGTNAASPLSKWSSNWIMFRNCVFFVDPAMGGVKPNQTIWAKSASTILLEKCTVMAGATNAIKLGADSDTDPETGVTTFGNGLCVITEIKDSYICGDIVREKSYNLNLINNQFAVRGNSTENCRLTLSGNKVALNETIQNCIWDSTGVSTWDGTLIEGGDNPVVSGNLRIANCQLDGRLELIKINRGSAVIECNRPVSTTNSYGNVFVTIGTNAQTVLVQANGAKEYVAINAPGAIKADWVVDERTSKFLPILTTAALSTNTTLAGSAAYVPLMGTSHKFEGGWVRIAYSVTIQHQDSTARTYGARVKVGSYVYTATARRTTISGVGNYGVISGTAVVYIPASETSQTIQLEVNQASGSSNFGVVQGGSGLASTSWYVELLNH